MRRPQLRPRAQRDERGVVAIIMALTVVLILVASGMVLDFGLVRVDRQVDQSAADSATMAGLNALGGDDAVARPFAGVCQAIRYLQQNDSRFATVSTGGTWTDGSGGALAPSFTNCSDTTWLTKKCSPDTPSTWARYTWAGTYDGAPLTVVIQSGFLLSGTGWAENALAAAQADQNDKAQGCDQLATVITQDRKPGLGSLVHAGDLASSIHSVGRVQLAPGGDAPAMILLDQHGCMVLSSTSGGSGAYVHVYGSYSASTGASQPGSIHSDSDASQCSSSPHPYLFYGSAPDTIVAYAARTASGAADPTRPGQITSVAGYNGLPLSTIVDSTANVYGASGKDESGPGVENPPTGRPLVTRAPVDDRYLTGVTTAVSDAQSNVFGSLTAANAVSRGYTVVSSCNPTSLPSLATAPKLFVDCPGTYKGTAVVNSSVVVFSGKVAPSPTLSMPNADHVYIFGSAGGDAIALGTGNTFSMHTNANLGSGQCTSNSVTGDKAVLFVKAGDIKGNGGLLQLCRTTVFMMGNRADGCLPTTHGTAPTATPCGGGTGDGQINLSGGSGVDWTAPNTMDQTTDAAGNPLPGALAAWGDSDGPEDLALWDESAGLSSNPSYALKGGGALHTVGVFMVPNAAPFTIGGGPSQVLTNAQYVASDIALNGGAQLSMSVDPNAAVTLPKLKVVGLVR